jgi:hypothetical protein
MSSVILHLPKEWTSSPISKIGEVDSSYKEIHIHVDEIVNIKVPDGIFRIIVILEPFEHLKNSMIKYFSHHKDCYSHIFTYHQDILDNFQNSTISVTPTTWTGDYIDKGKDFSVSTVVGNKHLSRCLPGLEGYSLRWDLFNRKNQISIPNRFYLSSNSPIKELDYSKNLVLGKSKSPLFNSQFHIAIENTNKIDNAFSEKLIDCFQTRTIPIYYGPKNIGNFFNINGIFVCKNVDEIIEVCNSIDEKTYDSLNKAIDENYKISMEYKSLPETLLNNIKRLFLKEEENG